MPATRQCAWTYLLVLDSFLYLQPIPGLNPIAFSMHDIREYNFRWVWHYFLTMHATRQCNWTYFLVLDSFLLLSPDPFGRLKLSRLALMRRADTKTMLIQLKNAVSSKMQYSKYRIATCCQNIVAMLLCGKTFQNRWREYWSMTGPKECQNYDGDYAVSE